MDPRRIVADGYDTIAERYFEWSAARPSATRAGWLRRALDAIPSGAVVVDLGCGAGVPMTQALAAGRQVTGVDLSARQIELARSNVPGATFIQADMTALDLPPAGGVPEGCEIRGSAGHLQRKYLCFNRRWSPPFSEI